MRGERGLLCEYMKGCCCEYVNDALKCWDMVGYGDREREIIGGCVCMGYMGVYIECYSLILSKPVELGVEVMEVL